MKITFKCTECVGNGLSNVDFQDVEINSEGIYVITCDEGHKTLKFTSEPLFDVLFDFAAYSLLDGYRREAVVNFVASLERFYEYCIQIMSFEAGIEFNEFNTTWKLVKRSERQIGAFYMLYLNTFKEAPGSLENVKVGKFNAVNFRNEVVHNGFIPSMEDTLRYGELVYKHILDLYYKITNKCYEGRMLELTKKQKEYYALNKVNDINIIEVSSQISFLNLNRYKDYKHPSFEERLEEFERIRCIK
ncbi:hypothetical protein [Lysinibacillus xylanilyticus]|uniref:hypothetical protein n=1 Tax=Lysinibacillus xylanilyticus TaxID=582475 RepID=UPI00380D4858